MADDQLQDTSGASQTIANPSQPASAEALFEAPADPVSTPESATPDPNRPVSFTPAEASGSILADSPKEPTAPLADPNTDSPVATESANVTPSPDPVPAESLSQPPADPVSVAPPPVDPSISPDPSAPSSPSEPAIGGSIHDSSPSNQPPQVQSEAPVVAPDPQASPAQETPPQSAEIKPEPPQSSQPAPLADSNSQKSSFGDILGGNGETPAPVTPVSVPIQPPSPSSTVPIPSVPPTSFGDLGTKPPAEVPTINIEPIEPPKPTQPPPSPQSPLPAEAPAKVGISPLPPKLQIETVVEAKADFSFKRQQALQTRRKKRDDHLAKILTLVAQKGKIHNSDAVALLRVSQSTATNYLHSLVKDGKIKKEGKAKATSYSL